MAVVDGRRGRGIWKGDDRFLSGVVGGLRGIGIRGKWRICKGRMDDDPGGERKDIPEGQTTTCRIECCQMDEGQKWLLGEGTSKIHSNSMLQSNPPPSFPPPFHSSNCFFCRQKPTTNKMHTQKQYERGPPKAAHNSASRPIQKSTTWPLRLLFLSKLFSRLNRRPISPLIQPSSN